MEYWTIEEVRKLPCDNAFGIKRAGEHSWIIGITSANDEGIVAQLNTFNKMMKEKWFIKDIEDQENGMD